MAINPHFKRPQRPQLSTEDYVAGILRGNRVLLSQAITLIESTQPKHQAQAQAIIEQCLPHSGKSLRLGITGTPGVGKSTFIEAFGLALLQQDFRVAVLAVDPSSQVSSGSILGDKTRMQELSVQLQAFIRPSAAGSSLGGVARKTRESIILCEAAGFDWIIVETVGVGQSEIAVHSMVDFFLLLLLPNSGDELQGIKRGVMEMADMIAINKADGEALAAAKLAQRQCRNALHLMPLKASGWRPSVQRCSALHQEGLDKIEGQIHRYRSEMQKNGYWESRRAEQAQFWLRETIENQLKSLFYRHPRIRSTWQATEQAVREGQVSPFKAGEDLLLRFQQELGKED